MNRASQLQARMPSISDTRSSIHTMLAISSTIFDFDFLGLSSVFTGHTSDQSSLVSVPISPSIQHWEWAFGSLPRLTH
jgi:hypothetical protein